MKYKSIVNTIDIARNLIKAHVKEGHIVCDGTVGNGNDTELLAQLVGSSGKVYGFDIQSKAIDITKNLLMKNNLLDRVKLINDSHEKIQDYVKEDLDFVIYNLGYLPKGDKDIKTNSKSTCISIEVALKLLKPNGLLIVTSYIGHEGGLEEKEKVEELLKGLDQKTYNVLKFEFINQRNNPPILYGVEKSK